MTLTLNAQTYSSEIKDEEIIEFMNYFFDESHVRGNDLIKEIKIVNRINIMENALDKYFSAENKLYLIKQTQKPKSKKWKNKFEHVNLIYEQWLNSENQTNKIAYTFSLPLFSIDKRRVLIYSGFFCGLLCGGSAFEIYEKQNDQWRLLEKVNEMAE